MPIPPQMNASFQTIAEPADPVEVLAEISDLNRRGPLASQGKLDVFLAAAWEIPCVLHEIGRLREVSFRAVGEGTGKPQLASRKSRVPP